MNDLDTRRERAAHNQALFREVNDRIAILWNRYAQDLATDGYICECGSMSCVETVQLSHEEYERLRTGSDRFFVIPGHEDPGLEVVVEANERYVVVAKVGVSVATSA